MRALEIYKNKSVSQLIKIAQRHFNAFIRQRDHGKPCINCGNFSDLQCGHFYPTSTHSSLRFDEINCNGECLRCNYYNSQSHAYLYRNNLIKKVGQKSFERLELKANMCRRGHKWDRFTLIDIIEKYKNKTPRPGALKTGSVARSVDTNIIIL